LFVRLKRLVLYCVIVHQWHELSVILKQLYNENEKYSSLIQDAMCSFGNRTTFEMYCIDTRNMNNDIDKKTAQYHIVLHLVDQ
jgi:hypothetical protein